ncbi:hypothetical protein Y1Q_0010980 [Alligator mississippiensis]|uniref:Uncharacterized protein n=1 Tax=Alligator mississippiensis TaxID=8496 RepID=A0A151NLB2_ALLMI|nr:hypothetical protein Y1Q_0010980 [Alligator mississippiensis]
MASPDRQCARLARPRHAPQASLLPSLKQFDTCKDEADSHFKLHRSRQSSIPIDKAVNQRLQNQRSYRPGLGPDCTGKSAF